METYKIYCNLKSDLKKKKQLLSTLSQKSTSQKEDMTSLEIEIEEDLNALNMVFNHLILQQNAPKLEEI